jgi:Winged helix DNA-binding domain
MVAVSFKLAHDALEMVEYRSIPSVLLVADSAAAFARGRRGIELAGCRVGASIAVETAAERLDRPVAADAVMVELEREHEGPLDRLAGHLNDAAASGRFRSVISAPLALVDRLSALGLHEDVRHLCEPNDVERTDCLRAAAARRPLRLHDVSKGQGTARLQQLSEEVGRIASILAALSEEDDGTADAGESEGKPRLDAGQIRAVIRARRLRDHFFKRDLFADPAWDMLLDLMAARLERQRVAVSSLCIAAAVPPTTALRWIKTLCDQGLFVRVADPQDGRRVFIELSDQAAGGLEAYLRAAQRISPLII